jgi:phosphate transport system permease protein
MTDRPTGSYVSDAYVRRLVRRRGRERWLRGLGLAAIAFAVGMLGLLFGSIVWQSRTAFLQTRIGLPIGTVAGSPVDGTVDADDASDAMDPDALVRRGLETLLGRPADRRGRRALRGLVSDHAPYRVRDALQESTAGPAGVRTVWVPASDDVDLYVKGVAGRDVGAAERRLSDRQIGWIEALDASRRIEVGFNRDFFLGSASRDPEVAGIKGAVLGSFWMLAVTLALTLPLGVGAAIYLERFAPRNRLTELIDVNIRNLAAIPSIVFGLLGLALFVQLVGVPRSTPLVGGLVLALMTLPTIVIASRAAIEAVPPSYHDAALQLGASRMEAVLLTVLPNAMPGILTGTIIGMAQALGETAPLLMVGMVAFVADAPAGPMDSAAPLPVQIFLWATSAERGFGEKTAAAIVVLLGFLVTMNAATIWLRRRFEREV